LLGLAQEAHERVEAIASLRPDWAALAECRQSLALGN
jgi:hypothetical protein